MRDLPKARPNGRGLACLLFGPPTASREGVLSSRLFCSWSVDSASRPLPIHSRGIHVLIKDYKKYV